MEEESEASTERGAKKPSLSNRKQLEQKHNNLKDYKKKLTLDHFERDKLNK